MSCKCHGDRRAGGPTKGDEKCPGCGTKHFVYRSGSYDWEPRLCAECKMDLVLTPEKIAEFTEEMKKITKGRKI